MITKKTCVKFFILFSLLLIAFSGLTPIAAFFNKWDFYFDIIITDAGYSDLDSDGIEDDIYIQATVDFWFDTKEYAIVDYITFLDLSTPANNTWGFYAEYTYYKRDHTLTFHLPDTVDESGWYEAYLELFIIGDDGKTIILSVNWDSVIFDPPQAGNGTPPPSGTLYIT